MDRTSGLQTPNRPATVILSGFYCRLQNIFISNRQEKVLVSHNSMVKLSILESLIYLTLGGIPPFKGFTEAIMLKNSAKRAGALIAVVSIWLSAIAFFPISMAAQQPTSADVEKAKKDSDEK